MSTLHLQFKILINPSRISGMRSLVYVSASRAAPIRPTPQSAFSQTLRLLYSSPLLRPNHFSRARAYMWAALPGLYKMMLQSWTLDPKIEPTFKNGLSKAPATYPQLPTPTPD
jgi:hypothetical protein